MSGGGRVTERLPSWVRSSRILRFAVVAVAAVVLYDLGAAGFDPGPGRVGGERTGSSFATGDDGTAALAELLGRNGHHVERRRESLAVAALEPSSVVFVLEPSGLAAEQDALRRFALDGGRLVIGGTSVDTALGEIGDHPPSWTPVGQQRWSGVDRELAPIGRMTADGLGAWDSTGGSRTLVGGDAGALLTVEQVGGGEIYYLADISPLSNAGLGDADNAALALWLAGDGRSVVFAEHVHGYRGSAGLSAIPDRWKTALRILALAALVFVWARGVRLGPPEDRARPLPPPRRMHVEALASTLARAKPVFDVVVPLQAAGRSRLAARGGLPPDASDDERARVAAAAGLPPDEVAALLQPVGDDEGVLAAGRALARLEGGGPGPAVAGPEVQTDESSTTRRESA